MKTTTKKMMALAAITSAILLTGCQKDLYDPNYVASKDAPITGIPSDFNWSTISSVNLTVNVDDKYNGEYYYVVEVFDSNPVIDSNAKLLTKGVAKKGQAFSTEFSIPQTLKSIAIRQTSPTGITITRVVDVTSNIILDFGTVTTKAVATKSSYVPVTTRSITVSDSDFPTSAPAGATDFNKNKFSANSSYVIPDGFKGNVDLGDKKGISLYIVGKVNLTTLYLTADSKLFLLPGAEVISDDTNFGQSGVVVSINSNASLTFTNSNKVQFGSSTKVLNKGSINANILEMAENAQVYNEGLLKVNGDFTESNDNCFFENTGTFTANNFYLKGGGDFTNSGNVTINSSTSISYGATIWRNENGTFTTNDMVVSASNINSFNACKLIVKNNLDIHDSKLIVDADAYVSCKTLYMNNARVELGANTILKVEDTATYGYNPDSRNYGIYGPSTGKALLKITKAVPENSNAENIINYQGNLQIECQNHISKYLDNSRPRYTEASTIEWVPSGGTSMTIAQSGCSEGNNAAVGHEATNPTFPIVISPSTYYTYAMEDLWPSYGDYDFNDIVTTINYKSQIISNDNKVHKLTINAELRALGANKSLAAAIQFDNIPIDKVKSVNYSVLSSDGTVLKNTNPLDGSVFEINSNGTEANQTKAVIPLFDNAHNFLETSGETNTVIGGKKVEPRTVSIEIQFTTGNNKEVAQNDIDVKNLNFFIVTDKQKTNRTEVHLAGYNPTDKANLGLFGTSNDNSSNATKYLSKENLVWGMMIPTTFDYPLEETSILNAYPEFGGWAKSGGTQNTDWYNSPSSNLIYK